MDSSVALKPHNWNEETLARAREAGRSNSQPFRLASFSPPVKDDEITCNACHREHHGSLLDIKAMTDQQCQTCHQSQFNNFETDHPEFKNLASKRRSRIAFDHVSHFGKHYPDKQAEFNCNQCHLDDATRNTKVLAGFDQSCGKCHESSIQESVSNGLTLISLPMLDMDAIEAQNRAVGTWPLAATGDFDGPLPPITRALLSADPELKSLLEELPDTFDFSDIEPDDPVSVEQAVQLVWGIKRLLLDLAINGRMAIQKRLGTSLGIEINESDLNRILFDVDRIVFQNASRRWLPGIENEIDPGTISIGASTLNPNLDAIRLESKQWNRARTKIVNAIFATHKTQQDDQQLAVNPLPALMKRNQSKGEGTESPVESKPTDPVVVEIQSTVAPKPPVLTELPLPNIKTSAGSRPPIQAPADYRGWLRDDQTFRLVYKPVGHADPAVQQWMTWLAASSVAFEQNGTKSLANLLTGSQGIGDCRKCHTMDRFELLGDKPLLSQPNFQLASVTMRRSSVSGNIELNMPTNIIHWRATQRDVSKKQVTKFSHAPHLTIPSLQNCEHCHSIDSTRGNRDTFEGHDPRAFISNFRPIQKSACASCHREGGAGNHCTQCHNYHVQHGSK